MYNRRLTIVLRQAECSALSKLAERERRSMRDQAAVIIYGELERLGLLKSERSIDEQKESENETTT